MTEVSAAVVERSFTRPDRSWWLALLLSSSACFGVDREPRLPAISSAAAAVTQARFAAPNIPPPPPLPSAAPAAPPPESYEEPNACPADMLFIAGDYCAHVEQPCLVSHYARSRFGRLVCTEFGPSRCRAKSTPRRFCIDRHPWPNQVGVRPEVMNNFFQAQLKCAVLGKRICTESEWTLACEGVEIKPFPYGYRRDARVCHGDQTWLEPNPALLIRRDPDELARLWRGVPNGARPRCLSDYGVADMVGNVDEVVAAESFRAIGDGVLTGGHWVHGARNRCRPKVYDHDENFYHVFVGFRCCAETDGAASEPRTFRQRSFGMSLAAVERRAGFSLAELHEARRAGCTCDTGDVRCRTMCGKLLGSDVPDGGEATRDPAARD